MRWEGWLLCALFVGIIVNMMRDHGASTGEVATGIMLSSFFLMLVLRLAT